MSNKEGWPSAGLLFCSLKRPFSSQHLFRGIFDAQGQALSPPAQDRIKR
jgi:hypothetical protein